MELIYAVIAFVLVAGVTAGVVLVAERWDPVARRLRGVGRTEARAAAAVSILRWDEEEQAVPQWRRTVEKLGRVLLGGSSATQEARQSAVRQRLVWAGLQNPRNVAIFLGAKVVCAIAFAYSYTLYGLLVRRVLPQVVLFSIVLGIVGFFVPNVWLWRRVRERQRLIQNALPDVLDMLVVCVEAGLALDAAVAKITEPELSTGTPLHDELRQVHLEFRAGRPRAEALRALGARTGVDEVRTLVGTFVQTEKLGTSLAQTLRVVADASRVQRRHRAEKAAHLAPLKMLFPIVLFLFPAIFVVTLAPAALRVVEQMGMFR